MDKTTIEKHFEANYQVFYSRYLRNVKKIGGDEYAALCPFHEDKNPSFNFNNQTGKYFCHGCGKKGHVVHLYAKINDLDTRRDYGKILRGIATDFGIPWEDRKPRLIKAYDYTDASGELLFQVCRYEPKDFRQRRPDGKGKWIYSLDGIPRVLYRLPEVLKAEEVVLVEGEKDADTVSSMGLTATTCPGGAKKWRDEYNESLSGKDVVLVPDNDNEGREHMAQIGTALGGFASSLKWIALPDVPSKGDVTDWISKFTDKTAAAERLSIMIDQAEPYEPPRAITFEDVVLKAEEFVRIEMPSRKGFLHPWLREQSIHLVAGWRGVGKTWFAESILDVVTSRKPLGPWQAGIAVPCLFLDAEMPAQDVVDRLKALNPDPRRECPLYVYSDSYANSFGLPRASLLSEKWRTQMRRLLTTRGIKLWVLDNLSALGCGDENLKRDWDPIAGWLLDLRFAGISTILLHHTGKGGDQRGTSAREDNIDASIQLRHPFDYVSEDGARFIVSFKKARVSTKDLELIADAEFKLSENEEGRLVWTWANVKRQTKVEVIRMLDEGASYDLIQAALGISKGRISQIKKAAIGEGLLSKKGKLTQTGFHFMWQEKEG